MTLSLQQRTVAYGVLVAFVAMVVYANALANGFALDDNFIIAGNPRVHSPEGVADIWLNPYWTFAGAVLGLYRPGIISLYALEWMVSGGSTVFFHAVSIALHGVVSVLVFVLLRRFSSASAALIGALVFAVHPVHTEVVANVVGQAEIVAALAVLAACLVHTGRPEGVDVPWGRCIAVMALFALALTTKENAVVLPALLVLCDFVQRRVRLTWRGFADYADAMLMPVFLLAATLALYLIFRYEALGGTLIGSDAAPALPYLREQHRVLNALRAFPEFIRLLFWPMDLASDYSPAAILPVDSVRPMVVLGAALLTGMVVLASLTPWLPHAGFPAAWFLISIVTVSNLFFPTGVLIAERTLYLPSVAVSATLALFWHAAAPHAKPAARRHAILVVPLIVAALGVRTWVRNPVWDSTEALQESLKRDQPGSYRTQWTIATQLWEGNQIAEAETRFEVAYRLYPRDSQLLAEYGSFLVSQGRFQDALPMLEQAYEFHPWITRTAVVLMHVYLALGRYDDAIRVATHAQVAGARPDVALAVRAYAYQQGGRLPDAIGSWRVAVDHAPEESWRLRGYLARAEAAAGMATAAIVSVKAARRFASDSTDHAILDSVVAAIHNGCYQHEASAMSPTALLPPGQPLGVGCDLLGHWFDYMLVGQNANRLQNATPSTGPKTDRHG